MRAHWIIVGQPFCVSPDLYLLLVLAASPANCHSSKSHSRQPTARRPNLIGRGKRPAAIASSIAVGRRPVYCGKSLLRIMRSRRGSAGFPGASAGGFRGVAVFVGNLVRVCAIVAPPVGATRVC